MTRCFILLTLALITVGSAHAQNPGRILGTVTSETGQPITGASVVVVGTARGIITSANGRYILTGVPAGVHQITVSLIGYADETRSVTVAAGESVTADFQLRAQAVLLEGLVAVGYGTQQRRTVTGSVASVSPQQIAEAPTPNIVKALQNRVPGVDITSTGQKPGDGVSIRIRGVRSITAGNEPLFVVNGVPIAGGIGDFSPNDVVSVEILKDAAATAIYGSRGANGVVLITTKGAGGGSLATQFTASTSVARQTAAGLPQMMDAEQYVKMLQDAALYAADGTGTDPQRLLNNVAYDHYTNGRFTNWTDLIQRTGIQQDYQVGMSGSSGNTSFSVSGNFVEQTGTAVGLAFNRMIGSAGVDHVHGRLRLGVTTTYSRQLQEVAGGDGLWGAARQQTGFGAPYNDDGVLVTNPDGDPLAYNPLKLVQGRVSDNRRDRLLATAFANFNLLDGVDFRVNFGPDYTQSSQGNFTGADVQFGGAADRRASFNQQTNFQYILDNVLTVNRRFGGIHQLEGTALYGIQQGRYNFTNASAENIPYDEALYYALGQGDRFQSNSGLTETALESYMGRAVYTLLDRYTVMGAVRRDGSSVLAPGNKWTTFPTVGLAWQLGDESFMQGIGWLNYLKLRGSWGRTGNSAVAAYQTQGALSSGKINFGTTTAPAYYPNASNPANPGLGWEKTNKSDVAMEFGVIGNRVTGVVELYRENTTDLLLRRSLPGTSGYSSALQNIGSTRNQGVELQLTSDILQNWHGLSWHTNVGWARNQNEITSLAAYSSPDACPPEAPQCDANNGWFVGFPINTGGRTAPLDANGCFTCPDNSSDPQRRVWYDYQMLGVWQLGEEAEAAQYGSKPGQIRIFDRDGNGQITPADRVLLGSTYPAWTANFYNRFTYGAFDFSALASIRWDYMIWNTMLPGLHGRNGQMVADYWTPTNPSNANPSPNLNGNPLAYGVSRGYMDGSHWRIRNIQLGYTVPPRMANQFGAGTARIYATATEPYVNYKYDYIDPETSWAGGSPVFRTLLIGAEVTF